MTDSAAVAHPSFREALGVWLRIALQSFGGPAAQIAVMHRVLIEEKKWISEERFLHALNYCMLLPGPEAQQLTVYIGWLLHGTAGGLAAGTLFVLPGVLSILVLSIAYAVLQNVVVIAAMFSGLKAAVIAIVIEAVLRVGRRALKSRFLVGLAAAAFVALHFFGVPFPLIIGAAAIAGWTASRIAPSSVPAGKAAMPGHVELVDQLAMERATRGGSALVHSLRVILIAGALWWIPVAAAGWFLGPRHVLTQEGLFFSRLAVVTFGGAYAVLAYLQQQAVDRYGWVSAGEMADGLALAETTPGPLIMVVQFVAFLGAYREPAPWSPLTAGILGSLLTTWVTFVPCFLWIFLGAPYVERLRSVRGLQAALTGVTAAVVGVILHVAVVFAVHALFSKVTHEHAGPLQFLAPDWSTWDWGLAAVAIVSAYLLLVRHWSLFAVLGLAAAAGVARHWALTASAN
jgi:chromate transporter